MKISFSIIPIGCIRFYQRWIRPFLPPVCRFSPSCSEYAIEAYRKHGILKGTCLTAWRILRCNPFCKGGYDPVPDQWPKQDNSSNSSMDSTRSEKRSLL